jgi:hypothetical protein
MDKPTLYIETSIVSYLAADPSRHPVTARNQRLTHAWWNTRRERFELCTSEAVVREVSLGDPAMVQRRLALLGGIRVLPVEERVTALSLDVRNALRLPERAATDALHVAFTAINRVAYLLTWNCTHLANPALWPRMERVCHEHGSKLPILCTPAELMEE